MLLKKGYLARLGTPSAAGARPCSFLRLGSQGVAGCKAHLGLGFKDTFTQNPKTLTLNPKPKTQDP